jgi:hypothetical protein
MKKVRLCCLHLPDGPARYAAKAAYYGVFSAHLLRTTAFGYSFFLPAAGLSLIG